MTPYYQDGAVTLHQGDCLDVIRELPDSSVDSVVTDPPYGLAFMGKKWDDHVDGRRFGAWCQEWATECLRVLKPGGHMLAFGGTRTAHRLACAIEDAGFEIRDTIAWLYGSGFPKSLDVSKAIDKAAGADREVIAPNPWAFKGDQNTVGATVFEAGADGSYVRVPVTTPTTEDARRWQGWGTALKPAFEPIAVARKPLDGTVAANVLEYGVGALNIDGCRIPGEVPSVPQPDFTQVNGVTTHLDAHARNGEMSSAPGGRWPANVTLDEDQAAALDEQSGTLTSGANPTRRNSDKFRDSYGEFKGQAECTPARGVDKGGASRFFYVAKAATTERPREGAVAHPTVKPLSLMRWLVRLVTPPQGLVLDPFAGSGTTAEACIVEGFRCITIEREADYLPLILARITKPIETVLDFGAAS